MTIKIDEDKTQNTVSINLATLAPSAILAVQQFIYTLDRSVDDREDIGDEGRWQTGAKELTDALD